MNKMTLKDKCAFLEERIRRLSEIGLALSREDDTNVVFELIRGVQKNSIPGSFDFFSFSDFFSIFGNFVIFGPKTTKSTKIYNITTESNNSYYKTYKIIAKNERPKSVKKYVKSKRKRKKTGILIFCLGLLYTNPGPIFPSLNFRN